jgi:hypothetical protein
VYRLHSPDFEREYLTYLCSMIKNEQRRTRDIKSRIVLAKAAVTKNKTVFTSKLDLHLRKELLKRYIWSTALYGAAKGTFRKVDQK